MIKKDDRCNKNRWIAMIVATFVLCFFTTFGFAAEEALQNPTLDTNPILLASSITPDYSDFSMPRPVVIAKKDPAWKLGVGVGAVPDYEGSEDYKAVPLLLIRAGWSSGRYIQFLGNMLKANVIAGDTWSAGPFLRYRGKRDDDVDNNRVKRMRTVDEAIELGGFVGYMINQWHLALLVAQDVNDAHDGLTASLEAGYTMKLEDGVNLGITAFTTYASDDYMETYFGIDADNANRSGLSQYSADSGIKDFGVMANLDYSPWENWGITGIVGLKWLVGDAADSPIVDKEGSEMQLLGGVMATYRF